MSELNNKDAVQRIYDATVAIKQETGVDLFQFECVEIKPPTGDENTKDTCRFCKQAFNRQVGNFYFGNFVCNNCVDIIDLALKLKKDEAEKHVG